MQRLDYHSKQEPAAEHFLISVCSPLTHTCKTSAALSELGSSSARWCLHRQTPSTVRSQTACFDVRRYSADAVILDCALVPCLQDVRSNNTRQTHSEMYQPGGYPVYYPDPRMGDPSQARGRQEREAAPVRFTEVGRGVCSCGCPLQLLLCCLAPWRAAAAAASLSAWMLFVYTHKCTCGEDWLLQLALSQRPPPDRLLFVTAVAAQGKLFIGGVDASLISREELVQYCSQW